MFTAVIIILIVLLVIFFLGLIESIVKLKNSKRQTNSLEIEIKGLRIENENKEKKNEKLIELIVTRTEEAKVLKTVVEELEKKVADKTESYSKLLNQKKSSEVRLGMDAEVLAPFLEVFRWNPKDARFIGQPLDFIVFEDNHVIFIEVKSGNSKLSSKQTRIRKNIEEGRVKFEVLRIKGKEI
jgi:predicted Holliday junction resolvase-like endonuclease